MHAKSSEPTWVEEQDSETTCPYGTVIKEGDERKRMAEELSWPVMRTHKYVAHDIPKQKPVMRTQSMTATNN
jgi:hypothetical protein